jgi:hypothetical protein
VELFKNRTGLDEQRLAAASMPVENPAEEVCPKAMVKAQNTTIYAGIYLSKQLDIL